MSHRGVPINIQNSPAIRRSCSDGGVSSHPNASTVLVRSSIEARGGKVLQGVGKEHTRLCQKFKLWGHLAAHAEEAGESASRPAEVKLPNIHTVRMRINLSPVLDRT